VSSDVFGCLKKACDRHIQPLEGASVFFGNEKKLFAVGEVHITPFL
jgi:hypothetical protein